jgi:hypothetical protein
MTEAFLHYLWQYRLVDMRNLRTDDGQTVEVVNAGKYNHDAGPDFFNARLRLNGTQWAGNVEIHINSSDWQKHSHHNDPAYDSCILHVVYRYDSTTLRMDGSRIPTVEIGERFPNYLWDNYLRLLGTTGWVACQHRLREIDESIWQKLMSDMVEERLELKSKQILISLAGTRDDWEETFYQYLSRNFGFQLNAMPFEMLARSLPLKLIKYELSNPLNIEAMLFGQAGMLDINNHDFYTGDLNERYGHLQKKYSLKNIPVSAWKYLRLRPVNFPPVRIAQLSALLISKPAIFGLLRDIKNTKELFALFNVSTSPYWNEHYMPGKKSKAIVKNIGRTSISNIIINTVVPFLYTWGKYSGNTQLMTRSVKMLEELPAEENKLINSWTDAGIKTSTAAGTQSLLQLKLNHCAEKKCLTCLIGKQLINSLP